MKKIITYSLLIACSFIVFTACSDSGSDPVGPGEELEASIEMFGFYQEDNPDVLFADYVTEDITGSDITIALPQEADVSDLVARFTASDGAEVTVQGTEQESGTTSNDYSAPVEYLVSNGDANNRYSVTITEMAQAEWSQLDVFMQDSLQEFSMDINPETSAPFVAYISDREESDNRKLNAIGYNDGGWDRLGNTDFTDSRARTVDMAFSSDGTPYIAFEDESTDPSQASIVSFDGTMWDYVGDPYSGVDASTGAVAIAEDGAVLGFYINDEDRSTNASIYEGAGWSPLTITGRTGFSRALVTKSVDNDIYLSVLDFGDNQSVSVYKYADGNWSTLADHMKESPDNFVYYYGIAMDVDNEGNVFVAYAENSGPDTDLQLRVKKFDAENETWSTVGSLINTTELRTFDVAVDNYGNPMFLYKNENENPVVVSFDEDTNNWSQPEILNNVESDNLSLEIAPNGVGYAGYLVDNELVLHQYASPDAN